MARIIKYVQDPIVIVLQLISLANETTTLHEAFNLNVHFIKNGYCVLIAATPVDLTGTH